MNKRLIRTIELARALQPQKQTGRSFHLATIYDGPRLLSVAYNNYKHEHLRHKFGEYKPTRDSAAKYISGRHAECEAIRRLKTSKKGLTMCVVRIDLNGQIAYSKPCKNCSQLILNANLKEVIFSVSNNEYGTIF